MEGDSGTAQLQEVVWRCNDRSLHDGLFSVIVISVYITLSFPLLEIITVLSCTLLIGNRISTPLLVRILDIEI